MGKKNPVDRAIETRDWTDAEQKSRKDLKGSYKLIRKTDRTERAPKVFDGLTKDRPEARDASDDEVQQYLEDAHEEESGPCLAEDKPLFEEQEEAGPEVLRFEDAYRDLPRTWRQSGP
jgi:hypothetical protein